MYQGILRVLLVAFTSLYDLSVLMISASIIYIIDTIEGIVYFIIQYFLNNKVNNYFITRVNFQIVKYLKILTKLVELTGIEPATYSVQGNCSPS